MKKFLIAVAALAALGATGSAVAQIRGNATDDMSVLISQIQGDKRAVVLQAMGLTDEELKAFTPIYDEYQAEMKKQFTRAGELINSYASNYDSMTDKAAKDLLKEVLDLRDERNDIIRKYAKKMSGKLPATKVLRWVQIENKLTALLDWQAAQVIPLVK
jgi:hypothetical protein